MTFCGLVVVLNEHIERRALFTTKIRMLFRRKELQGARPHTKQDAEWAAGMGKPDNGVKQPAVQMEQ